MPNQVQETSEELKLPSMMAETNGGGSPESVPGFDILRAVTAGFESTSMGGPTMLAARPDGGFFSRPGTHDTTYQAKPENVIGHDSRIQVPDTATTPWRCVCHLEIEYDEGPVGLGTGFIVGEQTVLTAAHVLIDRVWMGWQKPRLPKRVRIIPGRSGPLAPYGYVVVSGDENFLFKDERWADPSTTLEEARKSDIAAIRVDKEIEGEFYCKRIGYFGLKVLPDDNNDMLFVNNAGYPQASDKPYGSLWYNAGRIKSVDEQFIEYRIDTEGGQSGSPIYYYDEKAEQRYVVGIHTTGYFVNRGIKITPELFKLVKEWSGR